MNSIETALTVALTAIFIFVLWAFVPKTLGRWYSDPSDPTTASDDELSSAALKNLWPLPAASTIFPLSDAQLDKADEWVDTKRQWTQTVEDRRVREAYELWLRHVEREIRENREENATHKHRDEMEHFSRELKEKQSRAAIVADTIPKPPR